MTTLVITETPRLYLREFILSDAPDVYQLNADAELLKYTGDLPFESVEKAKAFLEQYDHYQQYGFGRWAVIRKVDEAFLGWCGLKYSADKNEVDIGFRFSKVYWNQGYATEAAKACLALGFYRFNIPIIVGRAMKANSASVRVLEKLNLKFQKEIQKEGTEWVQYSIAKSAFK